MITRERQQELLENYGMAYMSRQMNRSVGDETWAQEAQREMDAAEKELLGVVDAQMQTIKMLEADRDHWRNMVNDLEHNSIYLDSIAFYEGRHAEVTARIAELEAAIDALTLSGADCYALVLELEEREEKYRLRIAELEAALAMIRSEE